MPVETERPKFLTDLLAEVDAFEAEYPSHDPLAKGETPCGALSPWLRHAYSLARYYHKQSKLLVLEHEYRSVDAASADAEIAEMKYKCDLIMEILWCCARAEMNLWAAPNIGVREDFTVIRSESSGDDDEGFKQFLALLMGRKK